MTMLPTMAQILRYTYLKGEAKKLGIYTTDYSVNPYFCEALPELITRMEKDIKEYCDTNEIHNL